MAAKFRAGKTGRITVGASVLSSLEWSTKFYGDKLDVANFESNGMHLWLIGLEGADWSMKSNWNAAQNSFDDPPGLFPRDDGSEQITMYTKVADNVFASFPTWACFNSTITNTVSGLVTFDCDGAGQDDFNVPTASV
jgi:hypothetical protein